MARKATSTEDKDTKFPNWCWFCKANLAEKKPRGIYCTGCRLEMARGTRKSVL